MQPSALTQSAIRKICISVLNSGWEFFSNLISGFDPAQRLHVTLAPANAFRAYVLGSVQDIGGYSIHYANPNAPLSGASIRLYIPTNGMSGQWIDPATGSIFNVPLGAQILLIPPFMFDVAL